MKRTYRHLFGIGARFVQLEGREPWWPLNDAQWQADPAERLAFYLYSEQLYLLAADEIAPEAADKVLVFTEAARAIARQKLDAVAISEIARDLRAAQAEYDLEKLIESIDRYLKQDEWFP